MACCFGLPCCLKKEGVFTMDHSSPAYHQNNVPQAQLQVMFLRTPDRERTSANLDQINQPITKHQEI